ncbi:hypothetical protein A8B73_19100 [Methylosinus sp. 3S-1]|nr:hypothetical protein A8B73_19100 [Methylosinus sp. 3S-1]
MLRTDTARDATNAPAAIVARVEERSATSKICALQSIIMRKKDITAALCVWFSLNEARRDSAG